MTLSDQIRRHLDRGTFWRWVAKIPEHEHQQAIKIAHGIIATDEPQRHENKWLAVAEQMESDLNQ